MRLGERPITKYGLGYTGFRDLLRALVVTINPASTKMALPYQCLAACTRPGSDGHEWLLFGATGSELVVQSSTGIESTWTPETAVPKAQVRRSRFHAIEVVLR